MKSLWMLLFGSLLFASAAFAEAEISLVIGKVPPHVMLKEDRGGKVDGSPWDSESLKGKVSILFYVDPDVSELNEHVSARIKQESFKGILTFAVVNMDATWLPNAAISSKLEQKQKDYPNTTYVKDLKKHLTKKWGLGADDNSDILAFDKQGQLIFLKKGKLSPQEVEELIAVIKKNL